MTSRSVVPVSVGVAANQTLDTLLEFASDTCGTGTWNPAEGLRRGVLCELDADRFHQLYASATTVMACDSVWSLS
jgi:hypothetical protein